MVRSESRVEGARQNPNCHSPVNGTLIRYSGELGNARMRNFRSNKKATFTKKTVCAALARGLQVQIVESGTLPFGKATYECR
jgi:hypothetical protein